MTLGLAVGDGDAAFGEGLADFGVDLIGGYGAGGAGVDPMRCLASAAPCGQAGLADADEQLGNREGPRSSVGSTWRVLTGPARGPVARWNHRADCDVCRAPHG